MSPDLATLLCAAASAGSITAVTVQVADDAAMDAALTRYVGAGLCLSVDEVRETCGHRCRAVRMRSDHLTVTIVGRTAHPVGPVSLVPALTETARRVQDGERLDGIAWAERLKAVAS